MEIIFFWDVKWGFGLVFWFLIVLVFFFFDWVFLVKFCEFFCCCSKCSSKLGFLGSCFWSWSLLLWLRFKVEEGVWWLCGWWCSGMCWCGVWCLWCSSILGCWWVRGMMGGGLVCSWILLWRIRGWGVGRRMWGGRGCGMEGGWLLVCFCCCLLCLWWVLCVERSVLWINLFWMMLCCISMMFVCFVIKWKVGVWFFRIFEVVLLG